MFNILPESRRIGLRSTPPVAGFCSLLDLWSASTERGALPAGQEDRIELKQRDGHI
jgi:hypothetical protein